MKIKIGNYPSYNYWLNRLFDWNPKQKMSVRIDKWDTWSMDHTLAHIIAPMLVQLKETQHGYPSGLTEQEWDEILDEMIWAFKQKSRLDWDEDFYKYEDDDTQQFCVRLAWEDKEGAIAHQERMSNGFRLFGKYYENLWD